MVDGLEHELAGRASAPPMRINPRRLGGRDAGQSQPSVVDEQHGYGPVDVDWDQFGAVPVADASGELALEPAPDATRRRGRRRCRTAAADGRGLKDVPGWTATVAHDA